MSLDPRRRNTRILGAFARGLGTTLSRVQTLPANVRGLVTAFTAITAAALACAVVDAIAEGIRNVLCVSAGVLLVAVIFTLWQNGRRAA